MAIEQWLVEQPKTIDIETVRTVRARLASGAFNVIGHDGPGCRVEVGAVDDRPIRIAIDGDTLVVDHPQWSWSELPAGARAVVSPPEATLTLLVPRRTELSIAAMGAEVLAVGVHGRISVRTLAGEVFLDETEGELAVQTVDGDINVREHTGALKVRTVSGHLTASGALREVDARTATGTANLDVTSGLPDRLQTVTVSGATTIRLPRDANPAYRVKTVTALAQLDGVVLQPLHGKTYRTPPHEYASRMSDVFAATFGGQITVLRSDRDAEASGQELRKTLPAGFHDRIDERVSNATSALAEGSAIEA
ncbi:MAG: hypothetical protein Q4E05_12285, partial [Pseudoclavibacter sp.]|nr:hypothetical protein [Pseudoclavibacter sp.]